MAGKHEVIAWSGMYLCSRIARLFFHGGGVHSCRSF